MTHDIFISHSSKDKVIADAVCAALESAKIRCWIAPRDILPGEKWASAISKAISSSRIMVLIFSSHSNNSEDVLNELLLARDAGAIIIPLKIGDILPNGDMEYYLKRTHWLDAMDPPTEKQIQSLVETVGQFIKGSSSISKPDVKSRVEAVALEPQRKKQKIKEIFQNKYLMVAALFFVLILGYWMMISSDTAQKITIPTEIQSQNFTSTTSATPIIAPSSNQGITSIASATPIITPSFDQKTITNSIGMKFVMMPAGEFDMGSPSNEEGRDDDEGPIHHVKFAKAFYIGITEVSQNEWSQFMYLGEGIWGIPGWESLPVTKGSWNDVKEFIKQLNEKEKTKKYRLPSEAEWEYAARAGTTTKYFFGDDDSKLGGYAWYSENSGEKAHNIFSKKPNPWGLYDMNGNVYEMVQDIYQTDYSGAPVDGSSWEKNGSNRVIRGGSWYGNSFTCRSADRNKVPPDTPYSNIGFRLVMDV